MHIIKQQPQDFCVNELFEPKLSEQGEFAYFQLKKTNYSTLDALQKIADALKLPLKHFGFAGSKDKRAITEQVCSAKKVSKEQLEKIKLKDIEIKFLGRADKPVSLGDHNGNYFKIAVRNITRMPGLKTKFINYFGEQRLSTKNALIGKLIMQKKFEEAVQNLDDFAVKEYLANHLNDCIGALKQLPTRLLKFYVHAYQSFLWNRMADWNKGEDVLPILGFSTPETNKVKKILEEEKIILRDFIIKQMPELSSEGAQRKVWAEARKLRIGALENDELNQGMKKVMLEFELEKGCYATEFIRQSFGN